MELKEKELIDLINSGESFILKVFMDDCSFCSDYEPVFESASRKHKDKKFVSFNLPARSDGGSEFKRKYMKANGKERIAAPATFQFEKGEMKHRQYGYMDDVQLNAFITSGKLPEPVVKVDSIKEQARKELIDLFAKKGEIITLYEALPGLNNRINELKQILEKQG